MIILTTQNLTAYCDATSTSAPSWQASYADHIPEVSFTEGNSCGVLTDTTAVTIVDVPIFGTKRAVKTISFCNLDSVTQTFTVLLDDGVTQTTLFVKTIPPNENLIIDTEIYPQINVQGPTGIQGVTGLVGETGIQGVTGISLGETGIQGLTGLVGETGIAGVTGVGQTGIQGETGICGQTGIEGQTGIRGPTGIQGETGVQGGTGIEGQTGIQGLTGLQNFIDHADYPGFTQPAILLWNEDDEALFVAGLTGINKWVMISAGAKSGAQGVTGIYGGGTGLQGVTGVGQTGIQGVTGFGIQGDTGVQGMTGVGQTGIQGETGIQGFTGLALGSTGIQGVTGILGQGVTGFGIQGDTGIQGVTGIRGLTGIQGVTGFGIQGGTGIRGVTGVGQTGIQGMTGLGGMTSTGTTLHLVKFSDTYSLQNSIVQDDETCAYVYKSTYDNTNYCTLSTDNISIEQLNNGLYFGGVEVTENLWDSTWNTATNSLTFNTLLTGVNCIDIATSSNSRYRTASDTSSGCNRISNDYGKTWTNGPYASYAIAMSSDGRIQTSIAGNAISSYDYGVTWVVGAGGFDQGYRIAMSSDGRHQTAVGRGNFGSAVMYVSHTYGKTWTAKDTSSWNCIAMSSDGKIQTAGTYNGKIYVSYNFGDAWTLKTTNGDYNIRAAMSSNGQIQAIAADGMWLSKNYGQTWTHVAQPGYDIRAFAMSKNGKYLAAASYNSNVYASTNYGNSWFQIKSLGHYNTSMAMSSDGNVILLGTDTEIFDAYVPIQTFHKISSYGECYISSSATTTLTTQSTFYLLAGITTAGSYLSGFTHASPGRLTYTGTTKNFIVTAVLGGLQFSTISEFFAARLVKNGTTIVSSETGTQIMGGTGHRPCMNLQTIVELATNDYIEIYVACTTANSKTLTAQWGNLMVRPV